jgi:hypothetical protein
VRNKKVIAQAQALQMSAWGERSSTSFLQAQEDDDECSTTRISLGISNRFSLLLDRL